MNGLENASCAGNRRQEVANDNYFSPETNKIGKTQKYIPGAVEDS